MRALKFDIYNEFSCLGPECPDCCCRDWKIDFTKREYLDYKKLECSPELRTLLDSALKRTKSGNELRYAEMVFREDGFCPMLGKDGLCMLQKEKGESVMSFVCGNFPRNWGKVGMDTAFFALSPTCCHVIDLLIKHPEGLALTEEEYDGENRWINKNLWSGDILPSTAETYPYIWSIKTAQLDILQNRDFTIAERLLILGYYTRKVCGYLESSPEKIEQLGAMMLDHELCRKIADSLKTSQTEAEVAAKSIDILYNICGALHNSSRELYLIRLIDVVADHLELNSKKNEDGQNIVKWNPETYAKNRELYRKIEEERPYIIENLLVMLAFRSFAKDGEGLWADYFSLAVLYNFLKIGIAAFLPENYDDKELAIAMTDIVKVILNAHLAKDVTMNIFAENNSNTLPHVAFLIS